MDMLTLVHAGGPIVRCSHQSAVVFHFCMCVEFEYIISSTQDIVLFVSGDPQDPPGRVKDGHVFGNQINRTHAHTMVTISFPPSSTVRARAAVVAQEFKIIMMMMMMIVMISIGENGGGGGGGAVFGTYTTSGRVVMSSF